MILLLPQFPTLYPDELLYSGIARYHLMSGNPTQKHTIQDLFGIRLACATVDLPSHLEELSGNMNNLYSANILIHNHTLFPYYTTFMPIGKSNRILELMVGGSSWGEVHIFLGLAASLIKSPKKLKLCRDCYIEDVSQFNEPYWHRIHQVPGVFVCPLHKIALTESDVSCPTRDRKFEFVALIKLDITVFKSIVFELDWWNHLVYLAEESFKLINSKAYYDQRKANYINMLSRKGYLTHRGRIRMAQLMIDFCMFFPEDLLKFLQCDIKTKISDNWFQKMLRGKDPCFHPIRHLLLHAFFGMEISEEISKAAHPFGKTPWPCLNKAADHYMQNVIDECEVTQCSKSRKPIGTFNCSCGFNYARKGPDEGVEDRNRIGRIKSFGQHWIQQLQRLNLQSLSLRAKAAKLGVDPVTIKNQTERLLQRHSNEVDKDNTLQELITRQGRFLISLQEAKECNNSFRQLNPKDYAWLYRHERTWLKLTILEHKKIPAEGQLIIDWQKRDKAILPVIEKAIQVIKNADKPQRITIAAAIRNMTEIVPVVIEKCLHKLPQTNSFLKAQIETTGKFQVRRLEWAAIELKAANLKIQGWKLLKVAGLNNPLRPEVEAKFKELILEEDVYIGNINKYN